MSWKTFGLAFFLALAICLTGSLAPAVADPPDDCCTHGSLYGDGSDGDLTVYPGVTHELEPEKKYRNVTVRGGATLDTQGNVLLVCGTLTVLPGGVITDHQSGGDGGDGGDGGLGGNPDDGTPGCNGSDPTGCGRVCDDCTDGEDGSPGNPPSVPQPDDNGWGGCGGGGGGGGGGAFHDWPTPARDADGGNGGGAGKGGKGGGYILIYAYRLDNQWVIHADGHEAPDNEEEDGAQDAPPGDSTDPMGYENCGAEYYEWLTGDLAGGGAGGGGGGRGGSGGTVEIYYAELVNEGDIHALGGGGGTGGTGGSDGGYCTHGNAGDNGYQNGCLGGDGCGPVSYCGDGGAGGRGEHWPGNSAEDGENGFWGCLGENGDWTLTHLACPCQILTVYPDGSGPYPTIWDALIAANDCDIIELADGTFIGNGNLRGRNEITYTIFRPAESCSSSPRGMRGAED